MVLARTITNDTYRVFATTSAYMQNDRTWCVSLAKPIPVWLNMWQIASEPIWCLAFITVYLEGLILYLLMRYERGHAGYMKKDFHYCVLMIATVAFSGMPHMTYHPKSKRMSLFVGLILMTGILISTAWNCFLVKVLTSPKYNAQVSIVAELVEKDFHFVGLHNGKDLMLMQPAKVRFYGIQHDITFIEYILHLFSVSQGQSISRQCRYRFMLSRTETGW